MLTLYTRYYHHFRFGVSNENIVGVKRITILVRSTISFSFHVLPIHVNSLLLPSNGQSDFKYVIIDMKKSHGTERRREKEKRGGEGGRSAWHQTLKDAPL